MGEVLRSFFALIFMRQAAAPFAIALLMAWLIAFDGSRPVPAAAAVDVPPGTVSEKQRNILKDIVAAFDQAESAVQQADLDALMGFYAKAYNYHGLKRADVRRVWTEVFAHYRQVTSKHVFTELKVVESGREMKAFVTCTGGLYGTEKETGKAVTIDSWVNEIHSLVKEREGWKFRGNVSGAGPVAPPASAPHHPLF